MHVDAVQRYLDSLHILQDARPESEFAVSRLQGAERVDPDDLSDGLSRAEDVISHTPVDHPVVVYCSVGYRSSMVAEKLLERWAAAKGNFGEDLL